MAAGSIGIDENSVEQVAMFACLGCARLVAAFLIISMISGHLVMAANDQRCFLYSSGGSINFINLNQSSPYKWINQRHGLVTSSDLGEISQFDFILEDATFFWVDLLEEKIKKIQMPSKFLCEDTSVDDYSFNVTELFSISLMPYDGFACDWLSRNLYWVDSEEGRIELGSIDGRSRKTIVWSGLDQPRVLSLDPLRGYMYWIDVGVEPRIERCGLDGSDRSSLVKRPLIGVPSSLTVDLIGQNVYWFDQEMHSIYYSDLNGKNINKLPHSNSSFLNPSFSYSFSMAVGVDSIYYVDSKKLFLKTGDKLNLSYHHNIWRFSEAPKEIKLLENQATFQDNHKKSPKNLCGSAGCSHLCLSSPTSPYFTCDCPSGVVLLSDNKTCNAGPSQMLLLARQTDVRRISLDTPDFTDTLVTNENHGMIVAIDYDPVEEKVYWTDVDLHVIKRSKVNGEGLEAVLDEGIHTPEGVAIDWVSRYFYWTDTGSDRIEVSDVKGSMRRVVIRDMLDEPRAIVVDPYECLLFWSDWGIRKRIEKSSLDGSNRTTIIDWNISWPNGLALDRPMKRLYWADAQFDSIESCDYNGLDRKKIVTGDLPHVFGLALIGDHIYWTEWQRRVMERANKISGKSRLVVIEELPNLMGIAAVYSRISQTAGQNISNECLKNNGGCSHFCFRLQNGGQRCSCPEGLVLSELNKRSCRSPPAYLVFSDGDNVKFQMLSGLSWIDGEDVGGDGNVEDAEEGSLDGNVLAVSDDEGEDVDGGDGDYADGGKNDIVKGSSISDGAKGLKISKDQGIQKNIMLDYILTDGVLLLYDLTVKVMSEFHMDSLNHVFFDDTRDLVTFQSQASNQSGKFHPSFAVDWLSGNIYWTDWDKIEISRRNGSSRLVIVWQNCRPRTISVDPIARFLFWSNEMNSFGTIERTSLDGTFRTAIIRNVGRVTSIILDPETFQLFWADQKLGLIEYSSYEGSNRATLIANVEPYRMALCENVLYWSNGVGRIIATHIKKKRQKVIARGLKGQADLKVIHPSIQRGYSFCSMSRNGGCSDLCINLNINGVGSRVTHRCACPTQFVLSKEDNSTCKASSVAAYLATSSRITSLSLEEISDSPDVLLPLYSSHPLRSIEYDPFHDVLYFVEGSTRISMIKPDGTQMEEILDTTREGSPVARMVPFDVVLDVEFNILYWSDMTYGTIVKTQIVKPISHVVFNLALDDSLRKPKYLALHNDRQMLFWTSGLAIEAAHLKYMTTHDVTLKTIINGSKIGPICIDAPSNTLYWFNIDAYSIEMSRLNGDGRRLLVEGVRSSVGLGVIGSHLYWVDREKQTFENCLKGNGRHRTIVRNRLPHGLRDLIILNRKKVMKAKPKGKQELKYAVLKNECPNDHFSCVMGRYDYLHHEPGAQRSEKKFFGADGWHKDELNSNFDDVGCIPTNWKCDGNVDCVGSYDEMNCTSCSEDSMSCSIDKKCLGKNHICDGKMDCSDGSDESGCISCLEPEVSAFNRKSLICRPGLCHSIVHVCDGFIDCENGADETNCAQVGALEGERSFNFWLTIASVVLCAALTSTVLIFVLKQKSQCSGCSMRCAKEGLVTLTATEPVGTNLGTSSVPVSRFASPQRRLLSNSVSTLNLPHDNVQGPYPSLATSFADSGLTGSDKTFLGIDGSRKKCSQKHGSSSLGENKALGDGPWRYCGVEMYFPCDGQSNADDIPALPPPPPTPCSQSRLIRSRQTSSTGSSNCAGHVTPPDSSLQAQPRRNNFRQYQKRPPSQFECVDPRLALPPSGRSSDVSRNYVHSENSRATPGCGR